MPHLWGFLLALLTAPIAHLLGGRLARRKRSCPCIGAPGKDRPQLTIERAERPSARDQLILVRTTGEDERTREVNSSLMGALPFFALRSIEGGRGKKPVLRFTLGAPMSERNRNE